jgi:hypothetical protein
MGATNILPSLTSSLHVMIQQKEVMRADITECSGGPLPLIFCMHVHSRPIYRRAIYLVEMIIRYGIFQYKGICLYFDTPYQ